MERAGLQRRNDFAKRRGDCTGNLYLIGNKPGEQLYQFSSDHCYTKHNGSNSFLFQFRIVIVYRVNFKCKCQYSSYACCL